MGKFCPNVKLAYAIRGNRMERHVKLQEQIVIGTPGTILDWCTKYKLIDPKKITMFVLDEADVMIAMQGHRDQSIRIHRLLNKDCQMLLFSATFEDSVMKFAERVIPDPNIIRLRREEETLDTIKQFYVLCREKEDKFTALCNLYGCLTIAQAMIFCHTRKMAGWLASSLIKEGHQVALLSGEMAVEQRAAVIERFKNGKEKVLVTTNVSLVVNFDLPVDLEGNADNETYLHRIGRTGRFGRRGFAVNMVDSKNSMEIIKQIEMHFSFLLSCFNAEVAANRASALALTARRVSVGSKYCSNLRPHGALIARSKLPDLGVGAVSEGSHRAPILSCPLVPSCSSVLLLVTSPDRLSCTIISSKFLGDLSWDCLVGMDGRTWYLFRDALGTASCSCGSKCRSSSLFHRRACRSSGSDRERTVPSGLPLR
ncbi:hypothetical protein CCH79_00006415 [Gambusia affinis]|uniref:RNA helicase n=1 Tax=Gambusia affinis TaxID=33528 RepID=A0A315W768_GAMAF|nr:hypothetical protein CCH79_00006415 [Gambusia affinis]